jgi:hypothetical protein
VLGSKKKNKYISTTELEQPLLGDVMQRRFSYPWNCVFVVVVVGRVVGANCGLVELWFVFRKQVVITNKKKEERMK